MDFTIILQIVINILLAIGFIWSIATSDKKLELWFVLLMWKTYMVLVGLTFFITYLMNHISVIRIIIQ